MYLQPLAKLTDEGSRCSRQPLPDFAHATVTGVRRRENSCIHAQRSAVVFKSLTMSPASDASNSKSLQHALIPMIADGPSAIYGRE
jgi:hypothetical protein